MAIQITRGPTYANYEQLLAASVHMRDLLETAYADGLLTAPKWFQIHLTEAESMLRDAIEACKHRS